MIEVKPYIRNKNPRDKETDTLKRKILMWAKKLKAVNEMCGKCEMCGETNLSFVPPENPLALAGGMNGG